MKHFTTLLILLIFLTNISCQEHQRIEDKLMQCTYNSYADNGAALKAMISDYEKMLLEDKILKGNTGADYQKLLYRLSNEEVQNFVASESFMNLVQKMDQPETTVLSDCQQAIFQDNKQHYEESKIVMLETTLMARDQSGDINPQLIAKTTSEILNKEDLELPFYKMRVYLLMDLMLMNEGIYNLNTENF